MVEKTETVMDAVNAALGDEISPEPDNDKISAETDTPEAETPEAEIAEGKAEVVEGAEEVAETDAEAEARGAERNPDGTFKKKEAKEPDGTLTTATKEPPKKDPINDPIPKDLKKETSDRIRTLIDTAKTITAERDQLKQDFDYLVKGVEATGTTPQQYGETLSWLALFNSRDPAQQEKALELVEGIADRLATLLGKERSVGDPLEAHADLKDAVAKGQITAQYAKEIARTRNGQQIRTELTTSAAKEEEAQAAAAQELANGRKDLTDLEQTLMASDPDYAAKKAVLVPALQPLFSRGPDGTYMVRPSQWKAKFTEAYRNLKASAPAAAPKPKPVPVNQPLRAGKQPAGGQTKQPSSMLEAVSGALGSMGK